MCIILTHAIATDNELVAVTCHIVWLALVSPVVLDRRRQPAVSENPAAQLGVTAWRADHTTRGDVRCREPHVMTDAWLHLAATE